MSNEFIREERYIVFKVSDLGNSINGDEIRRLAREYAEHRQQLRKPPLGCVVVESDWPEYEPTWKAIEARVTGAQPALSMPDGVDQALQRLIENGAVLGPSSSEDALLVARYRQRLLACAPSIPEGWLRAIDEALVVAHIGVANTNDTYEQAKVKLDNLIGFHVDVATDPAVNGGWKLVPIEPTEEMREVGVFAGGAYYDVVEAVYEAMLTAAPEAKP